MHLKIVVVIIACVAIVTPERITRPKRGYYNGYYGNLYRYVDHTPAAGQFYNPIYTPNVNRYYEPKVTSQSQFNQAQAPRTQQVAYTHYTQTPSEVSTPATQQAQNVVTPVQHSSVVHHTPYVPNLSSPNNPYLGRYVYLNGKGPYPQVPIQPLHQQPLQQNHLHQQFPQNHLNQQPQHQQRQHHPQQHPLQKPLHYQQLQLQQVTPQKFNPSPQYYPNSNIQNSARPRPQSQQNFVPINAPVKENIAPSRKESVEKEEENANEEEEDEEEKGELNEAEEEDDEEEEEVGRYQEEEEEEEEEEEKPRYTNYSFDSNAKHKKNNENEEEEDDEDNRPRGYLTHEDVEEEEGDDDEDSDEGSSRVSYKKKTPKNFSSFEKKPPFNKSRPIKSQYERYVYTTGNKKNGKSNGDSIQGRPSRNIPVTVQKVYKEKWYVTREM